MATNISGTQPTTTGVTTSLDDAKNNTGAKSGTEALGRDDFMKLLVAQLKNQDPNQPLDTKELVTQLSQLTSVEQLTGIGEKMTALTAATNSMASQQSSALIGKTVSGTADSTKLGPTGNATVAVKFSAEAPKVTVNVVNDAGRIVKRMSIDNMKAGTQEIQWNGLTDGGERAPEGTYKFQVDARDKNNVPIDASMDVGGIVTGVSYENGFPEVLVGTTRVPLSSVTSISQ